MELKVGCCGWDYLRGEDLGVEDWRGRYSHKLQLYAAHFPVVEVNSTFYRLPKPRTARRWRQLADAVEPGFEFTVKVNRAVTHEARFRGREAREAFAATCEVARALRAEILLLQTPPSFGPSPDNVRALKEFLGEVVGEGLRIAWEPRGRWEEEAGLVREICEEFSLIHCTDPFKALPSYGEPAYLRLHGSPPGERMYRYTYTDADLKGLRGRVLELEAGKAYVLFNNDTMYRDARRFMEIWR